MIALVDTSTEMPKVTAERVRGWIQRTLANYPRA
jgi:hypothetical protein